MSFAAGEAAVLYTKEDESVASAFANKVKQRVRAFTMSALNPYPLTSAIVVKDLPLRPHQLLLAKAILESKESVLHVRWGPGNESWTVTWMQ
jgi:capsule polysaccharide modification protein KpsS